MHEMPGQTTQLYNSEHDLCMNNVRKHSNLTIVVAHVEQQREPK